MTTGQHDNHPAKSGGASLASPEMQALLRQFGQAWNSVTFYGVSHKITRQALDNLFLLLGNFLAARPAITFSIADNGLLVDGAAADSRNAAVAAFAKRLAQAGLDNFDLMRGVSREELQALFEILATPPDRLKAEGSMPDILAKRGLTHVPAHVASFRRITDSELVLTRDELKHVQELAAAGSGTAAEATKSVEQIVAFLKGNGGGGAGEQADAGPGRDVSADGAPAPASSPETDAAKLAELILSSADIRAASQVEGGESLVDLVVGSLRRQVAGLLESPAASTKQGRKNVAKTLLVLEKTVLERLREMAGGAEADLSSVEEVLEEAQTDLAVDSLASDYLKKRAAMEAAEKKVVRFLKRNSGRERAAEGALQEQLLEGGLEPSEWKQLVVSAKPARGGGGRGLGGGSGGGMETLVRLLAEMDAVLQSKDGDAAERRRKVAEVVGKIDCQAAAVAEKAERRLDEMAAVVGEVSRAAGSQEAKQREMSRRRLLEVLAEVVQELFQPLSVVNATVEMLLSHRLGSINDEQESMLRLSDSNSKRLAHLADRLRSICGNPTDRTPDKEILADVYGGSSLSAAPVRPNG